MKKRAKKFIKSILGLGLVQWPIAGLVFIFIWTIFLSNRVEIRNQKLLKKFKNKPIIVAFWHGRSMLLPPLMSISGYRGNGYALSSLSVDGRLMGKIQRLFGFKIIEGSPRKGGTEALRRGVRILRKNYMLAITPDGPRGPRFHIKDGILYFAKMTGTPIVPVCFSSSKNKILGNWDRFMVCLPFGRAVVELGDPIDISKDGFEEARLKLENVMIRQINRLDAEFGLPKIEKGDRKK
ncbi:MAG: lysophospholipid acyltransferase family protein [Alphaproteobacteria bacterium]|nr:lysophospholipid acyltransferase family protein [Alphaproteobacteria bacterium]